MTFAANLLEYYAGLFSKVIRRLRLHLHAKVRDRAKRATYLGTVSPYCSPKTFGHFWCEIRRKSKLGYEKLF